MLVCWSCTTKRIHISCSKKDTDTKKQLEEYVPTEALAEVQHWGLTNLELQDLFFREHKADSHLLVKDLNFIGSVGHRKGIANGEKRT